MTIRKRILSTFLTLFLIIISVLSVVLVIVSFRYYTLEVQDDLVALTNARGDHIESLLNSEKEEMNMMAASQVLRDFLKTTPGTTDYNLQKERSTTRLDRTIEANEEIYEFILLDKNGQVLISTTDTSIGADKSQDQYFTNAKDSVYIKDIYYSDTIGKNVYTISAPINDDQSKELLGIIVARYLPAELYSILEDRSGMGDTGENFLVNAQKYFISPSLFLGSDVILNKKVETENVNNCFLDKNEETSGQHNHNVVMAYKDYRNIKIFGTHRYIPETGWCLIGKIDSGEVNRPIVIELLILIFIFIIAALVYVIVSFKIANKISQPIEDLRTATDEIAKGDLNKKIEVKSQDEIGQLASSFDKMMGRIIASRQEIDLKVQKQTKEISDKAKDMEDQQKAILNILEDVEEEKENTTREKDKINTILHSIGDGVLSVDLDGKIVLLNHKAKEILGFSDSELLGKNTTDVLKLVDESGDEISHDKRPITIVLQKGTGQTFLDYSYIAKDYRRIPVAITMAPIKIQNKVIGVIEVFRDMTHEKEVDKAKTEFVSLASHQLRTPLSAINWYTEMLINGDVGKPTPDQLKFLKEIYKGNQRMVDLVNALLDVSRIELGTFAIDPKNIKLNDLAHDIVKEMTHQAKLKKIEISENYQKDLPEILADPKLVQIIIQNLVSNAVKYTPEKGKVSLTITKKDPNILIEVKDTGMGIPKTQQDQIFGKLFRADNVRAKDTEGTGLGLYIVKAIVDQSGGSIRFESAEGRGTTFFVNLPLTGMPKKDGTKALEDIK